MKDKFAKGDIVRFKGFENQPEAVMRVENINWESSGGNLKELHGKPVLSSISVGFYDSQGNYLVKDVHSNTIVKVNRTAEYHLDSAIKELRKKDREDLIVKIQQIIREL